MMSEIETHQPRKAEPCPPTYFLIKTTWRTLPQPAYVQGVLGLSFLDYGLSMMGGGQNPDLPPSISVA